MGAVIGIAVLAVVGFVGFRWVFGERKHIDEADADEGSQPPDRQSQPIQVELRRQSSGCLPSGCLPVMVGLLVLLLGAIFFRAGRVRLPPGRTSIRPVDRSPLYQLDRLRLVQVMRTMRPASAIASAVVVMAAAGCGAAQTVTQTRTVIVTASTTRRAVTRTHASPNSTTHSMAGSATGTRTATYDTSGCPSGEFDALPTQGGGCWPDSVEGVPPQALPNPSSCPAGRAPSDGGCAPARQVSTATAAACPPGEARGLGVGASQACFPSPNECIPIPANMDHLNNPGCPVNEISRGQAVYEQGCYGLNDNGTVQWSSLCPEPPTSNDPPASTFGLPCELLVDESGNGNGPYVPFFSGTTMATYAPDVYGQTYWTPACYLGK